MEALNLDRKQLSTKQLRASEFPEPADVYVCDNCGREVTAHLHRDRAHVSRPLGPSRYVCRCGQRYLSGAVEWDNLTDWEQRHRLVDVGLAVIVSAALAVFSVLVYFAVTRRSVVLLGFSAITLLFSARLFPLFIAILAFPLKSQHRSGEQGLPDSFATNSSFLAGVN
jgi:hypothetical protein